MKRAAPWSAALAATLMSGLAAADVDEADFSLSATENLYDLCAVTSDDENFAPAIYACRSFLEATVQYHDAVSDGRTLKRLICYPATATLEDARRAFLSWAEANAGNPKRMAELPVIGVVRALEDKYPCAR